MLAGIQRGAAERGREPQATTVNLGLSDLGRISSRVWEFAAGRRRRGLRKRLACSAALGEAHVFSLQRRGLRLGEWKRCRAGAKEAAGNNRVDRGFFQSRQAQCPDCRGSVHKTWEEILFGTIRGAVVLYVARLTERS